MDHTLSKLGWDSRKAQVWRADAILWLADGEMREIKVWLIMLRKPKHEREARDDSVMAGS
jgi:hypothetical protein